MLKAILDSNGVLSVEGDVEAVEALRGPGGLPSNRGASGVRFPLHSVEEATQVLTNLNSKHEILLELPVNAAFPEHSVSLVSGSPMKDIGEILSKTGLPKLLGETSLKGPTNNKGSEAPRETETANQEPKPKPPSASEQSGPPKRITAADAGLAAAPAVPELVWKSLSPADKQALSKEFVEHAVEFATNRQMSAAWNHDSEETALLAHLEAQQRQDIALQLLQRRGGLSTENVRSEQIGNDFQHERVMLMKQAVAASEETTKHLIEWRKLSHRVVPFLVATTMFGSLLVLVALDLVRQGRLNGLEMALLAFVFALMAISPATLLLIGRPLEGLDKWRPGTKDSEPDKPAASTPPAADKPAGKTT